MKKIAVALLVFGASQVAMAQNSLGTLFGNIPSVPAKVADVKAPQQPAKEARPNDKGASAPAATAGASTGSSTQTATLMEPPAPIKAHTEAIAAYRKQMDALAKENPITSTSDMQNATEEETKALEAMGHATANIIQKFNDFYKLSNGLAMKYAPKNFSAECEGVRAREKDLNAFSAEFNVEFAKIRTEISALLAEFETTYKIAVKSKSATVRSRAIAQALELFNPLQAANGTVLEISKEMVSVAGQLSALNCK